MEPKGLFTLAHMLTCGFQLGGFPTENCWDDSVGSTTGEAAFSTLTSGNRQLTSEDYLLRSEVISSQPSIVNLQDNSSIVCTSSDNLLDTKHKSFISL